MCGAMLTGIPVSAAPTLAERLDYKDYEDFSDIVYDTNYYSDYHSAKEEEYPAEGTKLSIDIYSISCEGAKPEIKQDAEKGNVLLICKKEDSSSLIKKYVNEVQIRKGENYV